MWRRVLVVGAFQVLVLGGAVANAPDTYFVAPDGDNGNPGTKEKPYATLERARQRIAQILDWGMPAGITVFVREGTYYLPDGLEFGPRDSGAETHPLTYKAYPGETPTLVGGIRLTDWQPYQGAVWQCAIPDGAEPLQVFENGRRLTLARTPDEGYFHLEKPVEGGEREAFVYREGDLDPEGWDIGNASVFIWPGHDWFSHTKPLAAVDAATHTLTMGTKDGYAMNPGNRYFVQNVLALLDRPGECCIDRIGRKVYVWPRQTPIEEQTIVISTAENLIRIQGEGPDKLVENIHLEGMDLSIANGDLVKMSGAGNCSVQYCLLENARSCGVLVEGHAQGVRIYGNLIRFQGHHGVSLQGLPPGQPDVNKYHTVANNHIHHCGRLVGHGYGVRISQSGFNKVLFNHIHHMPRYATTIKGVRYQVLRKQVEGVTWENRHDFLHSRNNVLAYNHIHHVNQDSQDTGAMESWGPGRDNVYDHNLIHDVGNTTFNLQMGMYLDDATDYFTVTNNIIYGVVGTGGVTCVYAKGIGNTFTNNIFVVSRGMSVGISSLFMADERADHHEYTRNIFCFQNPGAAIYDFYNWSDDRVAVSDHNLFWNPQGELRMAGKGPAKTYEQWRAILDNQYDQHSVVADPLFVDAPNHNYHLKPDSPALALGFKDIDTSRIGLKDDFPARFERE